MGFFCRIKDNAFVKYYPVLQYLIVLLLSAVTSSIRTSGPAPLLTIHAHGITISRPCEKTCFRWWVVSHLLHIFSLPIIPVSTLQRFIFRIFVCSNLTFWALIATCDLHLLVNFMYFQLWRCETARQSIVPIILNLWKWEAVYIIAVIFRWFKLWELLESPLKSHQQCLIYSGGLQRKNICLFLKHYVNPIFLIFRNSW